MVLIHGCKNSSLRVLSAEEEGELRQKEERRGHCLHFADRRKRPSGGRGRLVLGGLLHGFAVFLAEEPHTFGGDVDGLFIVCPGLGVRPDQRVVPPDLLEAFLVLARATSAPCRLFLASARTSGQTFCRTGQVKKRPQGLVHRRRITKSLGHIRLQNHHVGPLPQQALAVLATNGLGIIKIVFGTQIIFSFA
jgi:hypothetical protein